MVDLVLLQSLSYMAGALGVCVAAFYYALNIRETTRTRRVTLTNTLIQSFISEEGSKRYMDLMNMEWKDFDDFYKKYDSSVNPENFAKRNAVYNICDILGYQYLSGQLDLGTIWTVCNDAVPTA
jgi:DNA relaxase NicK